MFQPEDREGSKVIDLQTVLRNRDPFCSGICAIPDYQRPLYYTHDDVPHRIDFTNAGADDLEALYRASKPAKFGRNGENVLDESYRKAGKMDLTSFATLFDPRDLGINGQVSKALLTQSHTTAMDVELYKLNIYGKGDFFKAHKDTPRGKDMFGSLVVVLPTAHEGGQFVLHQEEKEWIFDFANKLATATEPSACFIAFYGDVEHEVLPVSSGYRVTLTYNLYSGPTQPSASSIQTSFHLQLKQALASLVNDKSTLPHGGYLGFGLAHDYVHTGRDILESLLDQLKGSDCALADVCDELGLSYSLRLFYPQIVDPWFNFLTTKELDVNDTMLMDEPCYYLEQALAGLATEEVESVNIVGRQNDPEWPQLGVKEMKYYGYGPLLTEFCRTQFTDVLEITPMKSSVDVQTAFVAYGNEATLDYFYGTACMLISVEPAETRNMVGM